MRMPSPAIHCIIHCAMKKRATPDCVKTAIAFFQFALLGYTWSFRQKIDKHYGGTKSAIGSAPLQRMHGGLSK